MGGAGILGKDPCEKFRIIIAHDHKSDLDIIKIISR